MYNNMQIHVDADSIHVWYTDCAMMTCIIVYSWEAIEVFVSDRQLSSYLASETTNE